MSDPLKWIPVIMFIGVIVLLRFHDVTVSEGLVLLAAAGASHGAISAFNNDNSRKQ